MVFVFNPDKTLYLQHSMSDDIEQERITIQPEDFELVVDVLLVALERARAHGTGKPFALRDSSQRATKRCATSPSRFDLRQSWLKPSAMRMS